MKLFILFLLAINVTYGATSIPSGPIVTVVATGGGGTSTVDREETFPTVNGLELRTGESYEEFETAGRNPTYMRLQLDAQTTSYTTAMDASGTAGYTPPSGRVFHVRAVVNRSLSATVHEWTMGTGTNVVAGAGSINNPVYYMSSGSGFPRYFRCESIAECSLPTFEFIVPNGRYIWANLISGSTRGMELIGYEVDEL